MSSTSSSTAQQEHLDWSNKQKRILTGGERAEEFYTAERGYPFEETELPHYHLQKGNVSSVFEDWKSKLVFTKRLQDGQAVLSPLVGAWTRLLFYGGWEHSSHKDERTYNLQTRNLFIDLRIPKTRDLVLSGEKTSLNDYTKEELRLYARQHVFAGYTQMDKTTNEMDFLCTRHHCIDWNFVGHPRTRPNKWYAELHHSMYHPVVHTWKEWAFAQDKNGQHYYCEQWERLPEDGHGDPVLALKKSKESSRDGIILVVGDHFSYIFARDLSEVSTEAYSEHASLGAIVDAALEKDDLDTARAYLSIQGGHGLVSKGWIIDCAIEPWKEQTIFWNPQTASVTGSEISSCVVEWNEEKWDVFDTTFTSVDQVRQFLGQ